MPTYLQNTVYGTAAVPASLTAVDVLEIPAIYHLTVYGDNMPSWEETQVVGAPHACSTQECSVLKLCTYWLYQCTWP